MANTPQAKKRARQNQKRRLHNASQRSAVRTIVKKTLKSLQANDHSAAQSAFQQAVQLLDKAAGKRIIHPNKAARLKSRLNQKLKALKS
ncbi:30S ribosomal protein S20 [Coxiella-like endosymbiont of Rhipicephalus sanguineus]|uniref:Small ribosomal subunit protein bS20 n=1 Tax=Candidatus Coxiella mudrowiae TaxID=2054173 RepID=A0ABM5UV41_9COXI|nr:30S ribosomal protein S20 [Candidatus Coxiella mudrowiae]AKQ33844.1 30S ribosomal protein S20 [Candidatus Coxiella mudrowiae]MBT8506556.1 30S ribosomal protein S20 [Coxiella-like endosymbiont of Rhipicephalus sanguineus]